MREQSKSVMRAGAIAAGLVLLAYSAPAMASDPYADEVGMPMGAFTAYPEVTVGVGFDDNVYATNTGEFDDLFYTLEPSLRLISNWSVHALEFEARSDNTWFSDAPGEDRNDWSVGARARLDVTHATAIHLRGLYTAATQDRLNPDDFGTLAEPTEFSRLEGHAEIRHEANNVGLRLGGGIADEDYDDATAFGGGSFDNDNRDHTIMTGLAEASYHFSPDRSFFVRGTYNSRDYDQTPPAVLVNRNSDGYEVVAGLQFEVTRLIEGEVYAGYLEQDYETLTDVDGFSAGASLDWYITPLTEITLDVSRSVEETGIVGAASYLRSEIRLGLSHELLRNLTLEAEAGFVSDEFEGITRDDDTLLLGFGAEYFLNRNLSLGFDYSFRSRESNLVGADSDRSVIWGGLTGRF